MDFYFGGVGSFWRGEAPPLQVPVEIYIAEFQRRYSFSCSAFIWIYVIDGPMDICWSIGWASDHGSSLCNSTDRLECWENVTLEATGRRRKPPLSGSLTKCFLSIWYYKPYSYVLFGIYFQNYQNGNNSGEISSGGYSSMGRVRRNIYWQSFNEDIISAARHLFSYTSLMVRWIYFGALDGPQTTEAPYATLLIDLSAGRALLWKQLVAVANPHCQDLWRNVS